MRKIRIATAAAWLLVLSACNGGTEIVVPVPETDEVIVYEWLPAPGQYIGDRQTGGMTGDETTAEAARAWAEQRLADRRFVSLGGFGGYIVMGLGRPIRAAASGYDFVVLANQIDTGSEPGIVYVMEDTNGNGRPDDTWYELRGSESDSRTTLRDYAVTYYRPREAASPVLWSDSEGNEGQIDYIVAYHKQESYYPAWIESDSYTLRGTRIEARNEQNPTTGEWNNRPYDWGYADNAGDDQVAGAPPGNGFRIANAVDASGRSVRLAQIHFVKVQTGVNAKSGPLGELSTEVCGLTAPTAE